jgi:flagellar biogenesis protein FliO
LRGAGGAVTGLAPALRGGAVTGLAPALRGGASGCFLLMQQAAAPLAEQSFALDLLRTLLALGLVCALVFVSLRLLARRGFGGFGFGGFGANQGPVRVLQRIPLEPRRALYLIAAGKRVLLVGSGESGAPRLIAELDPALLDADPTSAAAAAVKAARDA